jgi:WD40 repeat protein
MIRAHNDVGTAIAYSKFGFVATGANDGSVMLWDSNHISDKGYRPVDISVRTASMDPVTKVGFAPNGILAATLKNSITLWSPIKDASGKIIGYNPGKEILRNPKKSRSAVSISQDGRWYAVCTSESVNNNVAKNTVEILDASNPEAKPLRVLTGAEEGTNSQNEDGAMRGACLSAAFSSNSKWLAAGTNSREIIVWNIGDGWKRVTGDGYPVEKGGKTVSTPLTAPPATSANINAVRFSADNKLLAYATSDAKIYLWDLADKRPGPVVDVHTGGVWAIAFSPNGKCFASGSTDGTLRITPTADATLVKQNWIPFGSWWNPCFDSPPSK